jgi:HAD superfamily hydrolase (TIGR01509 family)
MIKAVAVDLGGVLFAEGKSVALQRLAAVHNYDAKQIAAILSSSESISLRKGLISDDKFWEWARHQLPSTYDCKIIEQTWYESYVLDPDAYQLVADLRSRYSTIAFSGNIKSRIEYLEAKYHFRHLFNLEIYSYDYHFTKPEKEFVEIMIDRAGVPAGEIVYIDDNEPYTQSARELGVHVIIHRYGETMRLRDELKRCGVAC